MFTAAYDKPFSWLIHSRRGLVPIQPQQLIELPCIQATGTYDLVEQNEEINTITWSYEMIKPTNGLSEETRVAWQRKTQNKNRRGHFEQVGFKWG